MRPSLRLAQDDDGGGEVRVVSCIRCKLAITYDDRHLRVVPDLLATHWADDHHLVGWRDAAAEARDRLWRRHPELLDELNSLSASVGGTHDRAG